MPDSTNNVDNVTTRRAALLVASLAAFLTPFMGSSVNIALPSIGDEFGMHAVLLGWVATSYILAAAMFLVPFGKIADIHGRKRIFTYGIFVYTLSSFLCAIAPSAMLLITFRVLQGIGSAMIFGTGVAILTSVFPATERGRALGINVAAVYLGLSLGPFLGGFLTEQFGWRSIFLANVPLGLIIIGFIFWQLKGEWAEAKGERFDFAGSVIYALALVAIMCGFSQLPETSGAWLLLTGVTAITGFVVWELRVENPVLNMNLFRANRVFAFSNMAALFHYCATFAVGFLMSLYLQYIQELSPLEAGVVLVSQPVVMVIFSPFAGRLSDRIESRIIASAGMVLTVIGLILLVFLNEETSLGFIILSLVIIGLGFAFFSSPNTNAVMSSIEKRYYGVGSATLGTMRLTGQMLGMGIAMLIFALYLGKEQISPENYSLFLTGTRTAFAVFAVLCFVGIFTSLARGKLNR